MNKNIFDVDTLSILAHELKSPIFNINSFLEIIYEYDSKLSSFERLEYLEIIHREICRLIILIDNLLRLYSINPSFIPKTEYSNLTEIFIHTLNIYIFIFKYKRIRFLYSSTRDYFYTHGSLVLIEQVLMNLIGNSLKYTFPDKNILLRGRLVQNISISICVLQNKNYISILDHGTGMAKPERLNLQMNSLQMNNNNIIGTGLGISIVKKILYFHNSKLQILSRTYKGSVFGFLV